MTATDRPPLGRRPWLGVVAATALATALRVHLALAGPELDSDALAHARIARRVLEDGRDVTIHWVWLPLWHLVGAAFAALGLDLVGPRALSLTASALTPLLLTALLRERDRDTATPFLAGAIAALWPLGVLIGGAAMPEATFQLLLVLACLTWERKQPVAAGLALAAAALLRYEAWALPPVFLGLWWADGRARRGAWAWLAPGAAIVAWVLLHRALTGEWLWFVRENRLYVADAWRAQGITDASPSVRLAPLWYLAAVPWRSVGPALLLAAPGAYEAARRAPRALLATGATLLAFVTAVWVARSNLGLDRHFLALVPLYATLLAAGTTAVAEAAARALGRPRHARAAAAALCLAALAVLVRGPLRRRVRWAALSAQRVDAPERAAAAALRASLTPRARVFCDLREMEVFLRVPPWRVIRWEARHIGDFNLLVEASQRGRALVVTAPERATQLRDGVRVLYRDRDRVVLRRDAPAVLDPRVTSMPAAR